MSTIPPRTRHPKLDPSDETVQKILQETAPIPWASLQRFFAAGKAVWVAPELDLIYVAKQFSDDNATQIQDWMQHNQLGLVADDVAARWAQSQTSPWACVVAPWVLVQEH